MAEIRLDRCSLTMKEIEDCFVSDVPLVATCRISELIASEPSLQDDAMSEESKVIKASQIAEKRLCKAIEAGARYVDVEIEAPKSMSKRVRNVAHENGTVFIRSYHDFEGTDTDDNLRAVIVKCHYHGADLVKVVTTARSSEDARRVLNLYDWCRGLEGDMAGIAQGGLIAFCMGEAGRESRLDCLRHGAPYTLFDADADAQIRYKATKLRRWSDSRYNYTETSFFSVVRGGSIGFERVPVDGSSKIDDTLMESLEPYNFADAVDFQTAYLAGYLADKYDVDADASINRANERIKKSTEDAFRNTVEGYTSVIPETTNVQLQNGKAKYALYPVWILNTTWNGQKYTFAMNGQTGKLVGDLPMDKGAYNKYLFMATAIGAAAAFAVQYLFWML